MITLAKEIQLGKEVIINSNNKTERGIVIEILTRGNDRNGIMVRLRSGSTGIVEEIISSSQLKKEKFIFYNKFFNEKIYAIYDKSTKEYIYETSTDGKRIVYLISEEGLIQKYKNDLKKSNYMLKAITRKTNIVNVFAKIKPDMFLINSKRCVSAQKMLDFELHFCR